MNKDGKGAKPSGWHLTNQTFLINPEAEAMGKRSMAATNHDVPHKQAMAMYKKGMSDLNIATRLNVSKGDVFRWRKQHGLTSNMIPYQERLTRSRRTTEK